MVRWFHASRTLLFGLILATVMLRGWPRGAAFAAQRPILPDRQGQPHVERAIP